VARREFKIDDEKRSYSAVFLLSVGLLLIGAVWSVWDDNISRRPWKYYQVEFSRREQDQIRKDIQQAKLKLEADPAFQQATAELAAARQRLHSGETAQRIAELEAKRAQATVRHNEYDLSLRIVKSRLEEAWYENEHALLHGQSTAAAKEQIATLDVQKKEIEKGFNDTKAQMDQIDKELAELGSEVKTLEEKLKTLNAPRERLEQKLEGVALAVGPFELPKIPKINQIVVPDFERNNFKELMSRVDRCESCHAGIDKAGFEDAPNPYKTHPHRQEILAKHPPERFGCTPCHHGQGAAVNSVQQAHGTVKFWEQPLLRGDKIQATCIKCHVNVDHLAGAQSIAAGQMLFEELGCHGCHLVNGYEDLGKVGPYLRRIQAKVNPTWLVGWVTNPHVYRPKTRMPNFMFERDQAEAIAAYLLDATRGDSEAWLASRPLPPGIDPNDSALVAHGKELVNSLGCRGCHGFEPGASPALLGENKDIAPNLSNIAEKTDARWIYYWLKGPRAYSPVSRMPSLRLSDEEAQAITSFLLTLGTPAPATAPELAAKLSDPDTIARGKALVRKYGCFGCHDVTGMENESRIGVELSTFASKKLEELFFGNRTDIPHTWEDWTYNKLHTPRIYETERIEQLMPQFDLADGDIKNLRIFLASRREEEYPERLHADSGARGQRLIAGRRMVRRFNCVGCHVIEGQGGAIRQFYTESPTLAPPILNNEGFKVQANWLFGFLEQPVPLRPWLKIRMPTFSFSNDEANTLVQYLGAVDNVHVPYVHVNANAIPPDYLTAARTLMSADYFSCFSCHQQGDRKPEGPPEGWAPDLGMASQRLNPAWIVQWLHNPQALQPGTKMPSFYPGGPDDVLGGNEDQQIQAITDYLMVLNRANQLLAQNDKDGTGTGAPDGAPAAPAAATN
jgi:mono/diheme cytochrome c family protein